MADHPGLKTYIQSMHEKGILDRNFDDMKNLQSEEDPFFVADMIDTFCNEADAFIEELTNLLKSEPEVNYAQVSATAHLLKQCAKGIGGCRVALQSTNLEQASEARDKESCIAALKRVKEEYNVLKENLIHISKVEKKK